MGKKTTFKGNLCNGCHFFPPRAASCYKAGKLIFSRIQTSSRIPLSLDAFIKKESGSNTGDRYFGKQANYLGVLYNLKFLNSLLDKPLEDGLAVEACRADGHRRKGGWGRRENLLAVSFMGTNL